MRVLMLSAGLVLFGNALPTLPSLSAGEPVPQISQPDQAPGNPRSAAQLLPETTVLYAEISNPPGLLSTIFDHPLRKRIEALDAWQQATAQDNYRQFLAGRKFVELQLDADWRTALNTLLAHGLYVGVDQKTQGVALLMRSKDAESLAKFQRKLLELTKLGKTPGQIREGEYRGHPVYNAGEAKFAVVDDWLLMTNRPETGRAVLDRLLGDELPSLADHATFQAARVASPKRSTAWGFVHLEPLRAAGVAGKLFSGEADNPGAEILAGGILSSLQKTPYATITIGAAEREFQLTLSIPHQHDWVPEEREYFFGPDGNGRAPELPAARDTLLTLVAYRNVSEMWLRAGDLFDEQANDQLAEADAGLTTLFAGRDFGEEILGTLTPQLGFIATRQDFTDVLPKPAIKLPQFALVLELREPERMTRELRRTFQSMIGFFNVVGAMQGNPQLEMDMQKADGFELVTTQYVPEPDDAQSTQADLVYNFSPSVGFAGKRFVVASTDRLARELVTAPAAAGGRGDVDQVNSGLAVHADVLQDVLADNREQLVAQNMLEEGHTREEAEAEIDLLIQLIGYFDRASLTLKTAADRLSLQFKVGLDDLN